MLNETINILNDLELYGIKNDLSIELDNITKNKISFLQRNSIFQKKNWHISLIQQQLLYALLRRFLLGQSLFLVNWVED